MYAKVFSAVVSGPAVQKVTLEFSSTTIGLPGLTIVGLPRASVLESKERVLAALRALHLSLPRLRVTVNLCPVDVPKTGSSLDLPLALGLLQTAKLLPAFSFAVVGELGLDGTLRPSFGQLALVDALLSEHSVVYPLSPTHPETILEQDNKRVPLAHLTEVIAVLGGKSCALPAHWYPAPKLELPPLVETACSLEPSLLEPVKLSLAGGHHLLIFGPPGGGKTHVRSLLPSLLPSLQKADRVQQAVRQSLHGEQGCPSRLISPHHTTTVAGLLGGGLPIRAGAITLAHKGILFLDELPEFSRAALEALRQPLEEERVELYRGTQSWTLPAAFTLVATANPCPCGHFGEDRCHCSVETALGYTRRISGPVLDRIDLQIRLYGKQRVDFSLTEMQQTRQSIEIARERQRFRQTKGFPECNRNYSYGDCQRLHLSSPPHLCVDRFRMRRRLKWARVVQTRADLADRETSPEDWEAVAEYMNRGFGEV